VATGAPARLSAAEGRRFALTVGGALLVLGAAAWWRGHPRLAVVIGGAGALLALAGLTAPAHLGPVYRGWMRAAERMSRVTTPVLLGLVYFLVLTPAGIIMRIVGRNPLAAPRAGSSAWVERPAGARRSDLERQF